MELLSLYQLNLMLILGGICSFLVFLLLFTKALSKKRRAVLILLEISASLLIIFDQCAYRYSGDMSRTGYVMVRLSNFIVFFITSEVVFAFNLYIKDILRSEGQMEKIPGRLNVVTVLSSIGMLMAVVSHFTGLYYTIDEANTYHRAPGFILCYIIPIVAPIIQFWVIYQYRKSMSRLIYASLILFLFAPMGASIIQIFAYGLSLTNITFAVVAMGLYIFAYLDINQNIERAHEVEIEYLKADRTNIRRLFDQAVTTFVNAMDARNNNTQGHSLNVARYARQIAERSGYSKGECDDVYYEALLHDIGRLWIPDEIIKKDEESLTPEDIELLKNKNVWGGQILMGITDYPKLSDGAHYYKERFDGKGYPEGIKADMIPTSARIIAVADLYEEMTSVNNPRGAMPKALVREELIKGSGTEFDPKFVDIMLKISEEKDNEIEKEKRDNPGTVWETEFISNEYREHVSKGIPVTEQLTRITMHYERHTDNEEDFSAPSIVLFDSYDSGVHNSEKSIKRFRYKEFGEIWFDGHVISSGARNMETNVVSLTEEGKENVAVDKKTAAEGVYEILSGKYDDHIKLILKGNNKTTTVTVALPNKSTYAFVGLTGEHCHIYNITIEKLERTVLESDIERISDVVNYTDRLESDLKNVQIDGTRSASTDGVLIEDNLVLKFHTMSLPSAGLVWHCPYIVLYDSDNHRVDGNNYEEFALVKLSGESDREYPGAVNDLTVEMLDEFTDWNKWDTKNKKGYESCVYIARSANKITMTTENAGIRIKNVTTLKNKKQKVYVAITGDQCALTDIRVRKET